MNDLQKVLMVGTALGLGGVIADMLPTPKPVAEKTEADYAAIAAAEAKRLRRRQKRGSK